MNILKIVLFIMTAVSVNGAIIINEIMWATSTNEFIELKNTGTVLVNVNNFDIQHAGNGSSAYRLPNTPSINIPAGGYLVIRDAGSGTTITTYLSDKTAVTTITMGSAYQLDLGKPVGETIFDGESLQLVTDAGTIVDSVATAVSGEWIGGSQTPAMSMQRTENTTGWFTAPATDGASNVTTTSAVTKPRVVDMEIKNYDKKKKIKLTDTSVSGSGIYNKKYIESNK